VQALDGGSPHTGQGDVDPADADQTQALTSLPAGSTNPDGTGTSIIVPAVTVMAVVLGGLFILSARRRRRSPYAATWRAR
jgi:hypothetical protein